MSAIKTPVLSPFKTIPSDVWAPPLEVIPPKARLLSISDHPDDHKLLRRVIEHEQWQINTAHTCRAGVRQLAKQFDVVFCESALPDGGWQNILDEIASLQIRSKLVVMSRLADAHLWSEVLNLGGFDVLEKPLSGKEVRQVLEAVSRSHSRGGLRVHTAGTM